MARQVAHDRNWQDADVLARQLHRLVTYGPWDLDIAAAMSAYGYDEVKWAEGQGVLAELVSCDQVPDTSLTMASTWYDEAAGAARSALATQPQLLVKLGVAG
jgi:hypothetical protein